MYSSYWKPQNGRESTVLTDHEALHRDEATHRSMQSDETKLRPLDLETIMSSKAAVKFWYLHRPKTMEYVHKNATKIQSLGRAFAVRQLKKKYGAEYVAELARADAARRERDKLAEMSEEDRAEHALNAAEYDARVEESRRLRREQMAREQAEEDELRRRLASEAERRQRELDERNAIAAAAAAEAAALAEEEERKRLAEQALRDEEERARQAELAAIEAEERRIREEQELLEEQRRREEQAAMAAAAAAAAEAERIRLEEEARMRAEQDEHERLQQQHRAEEEAMLTAAAQRRREEEEEAALEFERMEAEAALEAQRRADKAARQRAEAEARERAEREETERALAAAQRAAMEAEQERQARALAQQNDKYEHSLSKDVPVVVRRHGPGRVVNYNKEDDSYNVRLEAAMGGATITVRSGDVNLDDDRILSPRTKVDTPFGTGEIVGLDPHVGCYAVNTEVSAPEGEQFLAFVQIPDVVVHIEEQEERAIVENASLPIPDEIALVSARIVDHRVVNRTGKKFIQYKLEVRTTNYGTVYCWKRFSTFRSLCDRLHKEAGIKRKDIPDLPRRQIVGNYSLQTMSERAEKLNVFLAAAVAAEHLQWGIRVDDQIAVYKRRVKTAPTSKPKSAPSSGGGFFSRRR